MSRRIAAGFVLPVVLLLLTLATLLLLDMATAGAQSTALVARELLRLRTIEAAEAGLLDGSAELATRAVPRSHLQRRHQQSEVAIDLLRDAVDSLPAGLSVDQARIEHYRVIARADGARRTRAELTAGLQRLVPRGAW